MPETGWQIDFWHWLVLGGVLLMVEVLVSGFFFLWLAAAAAVVGLTLWLAYPAMGWEAQVLLFAVVSVVSIVAFRRYQRAHPPRSDQPTLNRRGEQYLGRTFTLTRPIVNGTGELQVDDTSWRVRGEDLPAGTKVRVIDVEGVILIVAPV